MSNEGSPNTRTGGGDVTGNRVTGTGLHVAVVAGTWHEQVMTGLRHGAHEALTGAGVEQITWIEAPGSFELPLLCQRMAHRGYDAVVALGVVIRGGTPHFEYVCQAATWGITQVALGNEVPIGFGVLTCDNEDQALQRADLDPAGENKGREAALAALATAATLAAHPAP